MFESIFRNTDPKRMQMFFHDNGDVEFRRETIVGQSVTKYNSEKIPTGSWQDFQQELYPFEGYIGISGDAVQIANNRYFHMEVHNILDDDLKPPPGGLLNSEYYGAIADNRAIEITETAKPRSIYDKLTIWLGAALIIELAVWGIKYVTS